MNKCRPWIFLVIQLMSGLVCAVEVAAEQGGFTEHVVIRDARQPEIPLQLDKQQRHD
ncbi:MAG TPA: hypothetical protein VL987_19400 [Cellvibrio sp.]|jgi:hypothetical protein|nr:hypothetical protein [Cellvibrio sp.]